MSNWKITNFVPQISGKYARKISTSYEAYTESELIDIYLATPKT
jgi:hypothetical protein